MTTLAEETLKILGENGEFWTRGAMRRIVNGNTCYCMWGAYDLAFESKAMSVKFPPGGLHKLGVISETALKTALTEAYKAKNLSPHGTASLTNFNDFVAKDFSDIKSLCQRWHKLELKSLEVETA